jgi:hypothetical protein
MRRAKVPPKTSVVSGTNPAQDACRCSRGLGGKSAPGNEVPTKNQSRETRPRHERPSVISGALRNTRGNCPLSGAGVAICWSHRLAHLR